MKGKNRTSRPEHFTDERTYELEARSGKPYRWFYAGLKTQSDREGRFQWSPHALKREILAFDPHDVGEMLETLARAGLVLKYAAGGAVYGALPDWEEDQHINTRETPSTIPAPSPADVARWQAIAVAAELGSPTGDRPVTDASATGDARVTDPACATLDACETISDIPPDPGGVSPEPERSENGAGHGTSMNGNGLYDRSRVNDASVTGQARVGVSLARAGFGSSVALDLASSSERETTNLPENSSATLRSSLVPPVASPRPSRAAQALPAIRGPRNVEAIRDRLATVLAEIQSGARTHLRKEQRAKLAAEIVFGYWMKVFNHPRAILAENDKREATIVRRYEEAREDLSTLLYVLDGARKDPPRANDQIYDGLQTIFRDRAQVERFAEKMPGYREGKVHPVAAHYARIFADIAGDESPLTARRALTAGSPLEEEP